MAEPSPHTIVVDPEYGYRRLDPVPGEGELSEFYESRYYDSLRERPRGTSLRHLLAGGEESERERAWLHRGLYADVLDMIARHAPGRRVLDVGAGTGEFAAAAGKAGFDCMGIEPSAEAAEAARERGLDVRPTDLAGFSGGEAFDAVVLLNVLEHVPDAALTLRRVGALLGDGGVCFVQVPNDFNPLQLAAQEKLGLPEWWVAVPDHVNYFSFESLPALAERVGFETLELSTDFPMEMFLLMGIDYVSDPSRGGACHEQRVEFDLSLPADTRRGLYRSLAEQGLGRQVQALLRPVA
jgi:SAM-dependent methyltransferase